jgi:UDP-N-acetylglucosamine/UDP-N-acetylgalactosamine diphosphorylase
MSMHPLIEKFHAAGQGQVFAHFAGLTAAAQTQLLAEAAEIDLVELERLNRTLLGQAAAAAADFSGLAPAPYERLPENGGDAAAWAAAKAAGEAALRAGRVAAFTVAGGQGTRLGYDGPKGTFVRSRRCAGESLFQVFAEKISPPVGATAGRSTGSS